MTQMFLSFTATFIQFFNGLECTPEDRYRFNCTRFNLFFHDLDHVPFEITWAGKKNRAFSPDPLLAKDVDPIILKKFREFQGILLQAERKHNVLYRRPYQNSIASRPFNWLTEEEKNNPNYMEMHHQYFPESQP